MVGLTSQERQAGRAFRASCQSMVADLNLNDPPAVTCSPWSPPYLRHDCPRYHGGTLAMPLKEVSQDSGRFRFTFLEGTCHRCGLLARSSGGFITVLEDSNAG